MGLRVVVIDPSADAVGFGIADEYLVCDLNDREKCLRFAQSEQVDGVMTIAAEYPIGTLAFLCERLSLPGISTDTAAVSTNKRLMREAFVRHHVGSPAFRHVATIESARSAITSLGGRVILKPVSGNGKMGITSLSDHPREEEIRFAFDRAMRSTRGDGVLVENYIEGREFSVEAISGSTETRIVAVTEKQTTGPPYHVEMAHVVPARVSRPDLATIHDTARAAVDALGIRQSASHTELRLTEKGQAVVMEVGARLGGGFIASHLVPLSTGTDMLAATINLALGLDADLIATKTDAAAICFFTARPGRISALHIPDSVTHNPHLREIQIYVAVGGHVRDLVDNSCRIGHAICAAPDADRALADVRSIAKSIRIETVPQPQEKR
jgi:biotin carboxylase